MTSRERIVAACSLKQPDRIPIDLGGMRSTGIMGMAYNRLKANLGMTGGRTRMYDLGQQLAEPEPAVLERFGCDVLHLFIDEPKQWKPFTLPDGSPCEVPEGFDPERLDDGTLVLRNSAGEITSRMPPDGYYFSGCGRPGLAHIQSAAEMARVDLSGPYPQVSLDDLRARAKHLYETTDYAIMYSGLGSIHEQCQGLRGWDQWMMDLAGDPNLACTLMDKVADANIERAAQVLSAIEGYAQVVVIGGDLGMQDGPQMSPDTYRTLIKPRAKRFYDFIRANTSAKLFIHTCGSVYALLPDLIEAGIEVLNPVQVAARDMDTAKLKREFGRDIAFWGGGCDTQYVLPFGTVEEVRAEVRKRISDLGPEGFVFTQVHNIQANTPPENIVAMLDAALSE